MRVRTMHPPTHGAPDSERDKKQTKLETKASSHEGQCIPAGPSVSPPTLVLLSLSIITMRSRLFAAKNMRPFVYALQNLDRNFANLVAPSTNGSAKCLVRYKAHLVL